MRLQVEGRATQNLISSVVAQQWLVYPTYLLPLLSFRPFIQGTLGSKQHSNHGREEEALLLKIDEAFGSRRTGNYRTEAGSFTPYGTVYTTKYMKNSGRSGTGPTRNFLGHLAAAQSCPPRAIPPSIALCRDQVVARSVHGTCI